MKLKTISAPTMAEALRAVKTELGAGAVILHTRTITHRKWLGMKKVMRVEVMAGDSLPKRKATTPPSVRPVVHSIPKPVAPARPAGQMPTPRHAEVLARLANKTLPQIQHGAADHPNTPGDGLLQMPVANNAALRSINKEVGDLKTMMRDLVKMHHQTVKPDLPESLFDSYLRLLEGEVADELADRIVREIKTKARPEQLADVDSVRKLLAEKIAGLVPTSGPIRQHDKPGPTVIALIGPTGVGKTTTVAKLAANLQLVQNKRVGLLTIDTYRIAAVDQLRKFSDIIEARLEVAHKIDEIPKALQALSDCDFILLDTAGRSPKDEMHLRELEQCLAVAKADEVHLVMSANQGRASAEMVAEKFGRMKPDTVIFTKLDEAAQLGVVLNVSQKLGKALSYVTFGQNVPNDIEVGCARRLARAILGEDIAANPIPMPDHPDDDGPRGTSQETRNDTEASAKSVDSASGGLEMVQKQAREEAA